MSKKIYIFLKTLFYMQLTILMAIVLIWYLKYGFSDGFDIFSYSSPDDDCVLYVTCLYNRNSFASPAEIYIDIWKKNEHTHICPFYSFLYTDHKKIDNSYFDVEWYDKYIIISITDNKRTEKIRIYKESEDI